MNILAIFTPNHFQDILSPLFQFLGMLRITTYAVRQEKRHIQFLKRTCTSSCYKQTRKVLTRNALN